MANYLWWFPSWSPLKYTKSQNLSTMLCTKKQRCATLRKVFNFLQMALYTGRLHLQSSALTNNTRLSKPRDQKFSSNLMAQLHRSFVNKSCVTSTSCMARLRHLTILMCASLLFFIGWVWSDKARVRRNNFVQRSSVLPWKLIAAQSSCITIIVTGDGPRHPARKPKSGRQEGKNSRRNIEVRYFPNFQNETFSLP